MYHLPYQGAPWGSSVPFISTIATRANSFLIRGLFLQPIKTLIPLKMFPWLLLKLLFFVVCFTLVSLGYILGLKKSILVPSIRVPYLGFISDSHLQAFTLLPSKKAKFLDFLKSALSSSHLELLPLQKLAGKCVSMSLAVPAARLFTNEINLAISHASRSARPVRLLGPLRAELEHWLLLES